MSHGLEGAGFDVLAGFDNSREAVATYRKNFSHPVYQVDLGSATAEQLLTTIGSHRGEVDLVVGGPPCQGFSIQRIGNDQDVRNDLVVQFGELISGILPQAFLMENVPGLLGKRGRSSLKRFMDRVEQAGFTVDIYRVNAVEFGVPQSRPRVLIYGWRMECRPEFHLTGRIQQPVTVAEALSGLPPAHPNGSRDVEDPLHVESKLSDLNRLRLKHIPQGGGFEDLPLHLRVECHRAGADKIGHRAVYGRLHPNRPANVITARFDSFTRGRFAHPFEDRNLTLREGARLQSFPDDYVFEGNREQVAALIGNAVPPRLAVEVGLLVAGHLRIGARPEHSGYLENST